MTSKPPLKVVATIEARMSSSRLPGKVLMPVLGQPMLHHLVRRLKSVAELDAIVLATTVNAGDDVLEAFARAEGIACFRGSEEDVMERVIGAADSVQADVVVEITGDCPIIDPQVVAQAILCYHANTAQYVSNGEVRSYPDGMDVQVYALDTLKRSAAMTDDALDHEHVTLHIRKHPELFPPLHLVAPPDCHWPELGLTLDEPADYALLSRIMEHFGEADHLFSCRQAVALLRANPGWRAINQDVLRKGDT